MKEKDKEQQGPGRGERVALVVEGVVKHPLLAFVWLHLNYAPHGLILALAERFIPVGISSKNMKYLYAKVIADEFGEKGLKALRKYLWPEFDQETYEEVIRPERNERVSIRMISGVLSTGSPQQVTALLQAVKEPTVETEKPAVSAMVDPVANPAVQQAKTALQERLAVLRMIKQAFLDRDQRAKLGSEGSRLATFKELAGIFENFACQRPSPRLTPEELVFIFSILKASFIHERSPQVLLQAVKTFENGIAGSTEYHQREIVDPLPKSPFSFSPTFLAGMSRDMAWGLVYLAKRTDLPEVKQEAEKAIVRLGQRFTDSNLAPGPAQMIAQALAILATTKDFPPVSLNFLRAQLGAPFSSSVYTITEDPRAEAAVRLAPGLQLPIEDNWKTWQILSWLGLKFLFNQEIIVAEGNGSQTFIDLDMVRDWVLENGETKPSGRFDEFISIGGAIIAPRRDLVVLDRDEVRSDPLWPVEEEYLRLAA